MKKLLSAFSILILSVGIATAQTSDAGKPYSLKQDSPILKDYKQMPQVDAEAEILKDEENSFQKVFRFGVEHTVHVDILKEGKSVDLPNGDRVYRYGVECKNALTINLIFSQFKLGKGARVYLVSPSEGTYDGAYTSLNNNENNVLGTELVKGERAIIELIEKQGEIGKSMLVLGTVVHGYRDVLDGIQKVLGSSGSCHYDVNCPLGQGWENQRNAVALTIAGGSSCSGSMVNNTSGDFTPYYLLARHCGSATVGAIVLRFRWERSAQDAICATANSTNNNGPTNMTLNGAVLRATNSNADFILLELNQRPDPSWNVYYAGWDRTDVENATDAHGIHHPVGDIKKISYSEQAPFHTAINFGGNPNTQVWRVNNWTKGVTEGGSSGSPLFNQNKRIIGVLTGGTALCNGTTGNGGYDVYGRFGVAWDADADSSKQLKYWLDPQQLNPPFINGDFQNSTVLSVDAGIQNPIELSGKVCGELTDPAIILYNAGIANLTETVIQYSYDGVHNYTHTWTGNLSQHMTDTIHLQYPSGLGGGIHTFTATILSANGVPDTNPENNTVTSSFTIISDGEMVSFNLNVDYYCSETTWEVLDLSGNVLLSGGPYPNGSPAMTVKTCLAMGCYKFKVMDTGGDGWTSSSFPSGSFIITDEEGNVLAEMTEENADFGSVLVKQFCVNTNSVEEIGGYSPVTAFPNPAKDYVTVIAHDQTALMGYQLLDLSGRVVREGVLSGQQSQIRTEELSGMYALKIITATGVIVKRIFFL